MTLMRFSIATLVVLVASTSAIAQPPSPPPAGQRPAGTSPPNPPGGQRRGAVQVMTLTTTAWADGGQIPLKYTQAGDEVSPAFEWTNVPDATASFVLIVRDLDAATGGGTDDVLHWMLWNIPGSARRIAEAIPQGSQLADGTRQISVSGPYYRGPGAPAAGPAHHYAFELYALDSTIDVAAVGQTPAQTRAAVIAAISGHVRGKAAYVGLFKR